MEFKGMYYHGMILVQVSSVEGFKKYLHGQTQPLIVEADNPYDWAYLNDYISFIKGLPVTD